jgi:hypothetical protein
VAPNEFYGSLDFGKFRATLGARARPERFQGLSSVNGDVLWSNNARPLPGVEAGTLAPIELWPWLGVEGALAHYWLNDDRFVQDAYVHYKYLELEFRLSPRSTLRAGMHHYAQWGGVSPETGPQPEGLNDFMRVFLGVVGNPTATASDQLNALGNHIGSYRFHYRYALGEGHLEAYFQNIFEDASGRSFMNFPDGVWGVYWELPKRSPIRGLLYEYVQTSWQSGLSSLSGNDNYFNNGTYESGWTYFQEVIGLPFFTFDPELPAITNNSIVAHHLGLRAGFSKLDLRLLASVVQNRGTRAAPFNPFENVVYTHLQLQYPLGQHFGLGLSLGADFSDLNEETFSAGVSLRYQFRYGFRM